MNATSLMARILALSERANAAHKKMQDINHRIDFKQWDKDEKEMYAELDAIDKAAGPGLVVGRVLTFGVADGNANYIVTKVRKNDVVVEWIPLCDGYWSDAVGLSRDKRNYVVNRSTAERYARAAEIFQKLSPMPLATH